MAFDTALVTGAGTGFGLALTTGLARRGTRVTAVARDAGRLAAAVSGLPGVTTAPGDITDPAFRAALADLLGERLDLLVHNAGELGPSPLPLLADYPLDALRDVLETTVVAPLGLTRLLLPALRRSPAPAVVTLSSDVAVEAYPGGAGTARRRRPWTASRPSSASRSPGSACTRSTPATCARPCTRPRWRTINVHSARGTGQPVHSLRPREQAGRRQRER